MFASIMDMMNEVAYFAMSIFTEFYTPLWLGLFISMFTIFLVVRLLVMPLIGSAIGQASSDMVKPHSITSKKGRVRYK